MSGRSGKNGACWKIDGHEGRPFEMFLYAQEGEGAAMERKDYRIPKSEWSWKTSEGLLWKALTLAGFTDFSEAEVEGGVKVINGSLAGPKGTVLRGQIDSLKVLVTHPSYGLDIKPGEPSTDWINGLSIQPCGGIGPQLAASADAERR